MLTTEKLKAYGARVDEGLSRCMNNEAFYLRLVNMALGDASFDRLEKAVESGNISDIFEASHALKGMLGNLALSPIVDAVSEMTELARGGAEADYAALWEKVRADRELLKTLQDEA